MKPVFLAAAAALLLVFPVFLITAHSEGNVTASISPTVQIDEKLREYERILELDPSNVEALNGRAGILLLSGNAAEARPVVEKILELDPSNVEALNKRGVILILLDGDYDGASQIFERIIRTEPDNLEALFNKSNVQRAQKDYGGSLDTIDRILTLEPENQRAVLEKAELLGSFPEIRADGHVQFIVRDGDGRLVGYFETDFILVRDTPNKYQVLTTTADSLETVVLEGREYYNAKTYSSGTIKNLQDPDAVMHTGVTQVFSSRHPQEYPIDYNLVTARIHGYLAGDGDVKKGFFQLIVPK